MSVTSPIPGTNGTRYVCIGWTGVGSVSASGTSTSMTITLTEASNITWNWKTQYLLTINTDPAGLGSQPNVSTSGPWYDNGTIVNCTAQEISGHLFDHWVLDGTKRDPDNKPIKVTMDRPHEVTAYYVRALAWWEHAEIQAVLGFLGIVLTVTLAGAVWTRIHRRKELAKAQEEPVAIEVSEFLPGRITTGYGCLDNLLFGGIPENYAVILTSPSCDETDLLIKRFIKAGIEKREVTFYVTTDPGEVKTVAEEFQSNLYLFICNPRADTIIKDLPNVFKMKGVENLTEISIALTKALGSECIKSIAGPKRACIEITSDVLLQHRAIKTRRWLTDILTELKSQGFTTLAVMNPQMHSPQEVHAILDLFEGEINIYEKETVGLQKILKVKKMYNQRYLESAIPLKKGILQDIKEEG